MSSCASPALLRTFLSVILLIAPAAPLRAADSSKSPSNVDSRLNPHVTSAVAMAKERLASQSCAAVLLDFTDVRTGRPISETLAATGQDAAGYLAGSVVFLNGDGIGRCRHSSTFAFTWPGSTVIFVCRSRFVAVLARDKGLAASLLVHETLHSLGLGEDPPSSEEISHRIQARCGL